MSPLPNTDSPLMQCLTEEDIAAYNICLKFEKIHAESSNKLRFVRILGFLLLHAPNQGVRSEVSKCIRSRDGDLSDLGEFFERYLILPFYKCRGRTPQPSEHPSQPSFEPKKDATKADITQAPSSHKEAKDQALIRDEWRCIVTGVVARGAPMNIVRIRGAGYLHCAHIIPAGIFFGLEPKTNGCSHYGHSCLDAQFDYSATILTILSEFNYDISKFNGKHTHSLTNMLTLESNIHEDFDQLQLYLEPTSEENHYQVKCFGEKLRDVRQSITITTPDPEKFPVPAPEFLALHAMCCKVAHFSGATEHINQISCDADELNVLSANGASGEVLSYMLMSLSKPACRQVYTPTHVMERWASCSERD